MLEVKTTRRSSALSTAIPGAALVLLASAPAYAHFHLDAPASWSQQSTSGSPQKSGPCGETDSATVAVQAVPSGIVTPYHPGDTVTIQVTETVFHPGHYRIALATDRSLLPADPAITPTTSCVDAAIENSPTYPVLADGVLTHTAAFTGPQTVQVTLPSNVTCTNCTLQVIEFMSAHGLNNPGGCFYHHCADISIEPAGGGAGGSGGSDAGGMSGAGPAGSGGTTGGSSGSGGDGTAGASGTIGTGGANGASGAAGSPGGSASGAPGATGAGGGDTMQAASPSSGGCAISRPGRPATLLGWLAALAGLAVWQCRRAGARRRER